MKAEDLDKLNLVSRELERKDNLAKLGGLRSMEQRQQPGSRPDGGMAPQYNIAKGSSDGNQSPVDIVRHAVEDAKRIVDNYEKSTIELESKIAELEARLSEEQARCLKRERMIQEILQLVGHK